MGKTYDFGGEKFEVSRPENCRIIVNGAGLEGVITIHEATSRYRETVNGWGTNQSTLSGALDAVCQRILDLSKKPSVEALCKKMDVFYDDLKEGQ